MFKNIDVVGSKTTELIKDSNGNSFLGSKLIFKTNVLADKTIIVFEGTGEEGLTDLTGLNDFKIDTFLKLTTVIKTSDVLFTYNIFEDIIGKDTYEEGIMGLFETL